MLVTTESAGQSGSWVRPPEKSDSTVREPDASSITMIERAGAASGRRETSVVSIPSAAMRRSTNSEGSSSPSTPA